MNVDRLLEYFRKNPEDELLIKDIELKFGCSNPVATRVVRGAVKRGMVIADRVVRPTSRLTTTPELEAKRAEIVKVLKQRGASVQLLTVVGSGCPDLLVGYRGVNLLMQVKDGATKLERSPSDEQIRWHLEWQGAAAVVYSVGDALDFLGVVN